MVQPKYPPTLKNLALIHQGKTRDTYAIPGRPDLRLVYATDRLSTHDVVHESSIPRKGDVLTALTIFWFTGALAHMPNHLHAYGRHVFAYLPGGASDYPANLHRRAIVVRALDMIAVEFVFRAYLAGSLYRAHYVKGHENPYGVFLPGGLKVMHRFDSPIFTPTQKSERDEPMNAELVRVRYQAATLLQREAFNLVRAFLNERGIEAVDWKGEVGTMPTSGSVMLADEVGTPDCCRFCELCEIREGQEPQWLDKQIARDVAQRVWGEGEKTPLVFDVSVRKRISLAYHALFERTTGRSLSAFQRVAMD